MTPTAMNPATIKNDFVLFALARGSVIMIEIATMLVMALVPPNIEINGMPATFQSTSERLRKSFCLNGKITAAIDASKKTKPISSEPESTPS